MAASKSIDRGLMERVIRAETILEQHLKECRDRYLDTKEALMSLSASVKDAAQAASSAATIAGTGRIETIKYQRYILLICCGGLASALTAIILEIFKAKGII